MSVLRCLFARVVAVSFAICRGEFLKCVGTETDFGRLFVRRSVAAFSCWINFSEMAYYCSLMRGVFTRRHLSIRRM